MKKLIIIALLTASNMFGGTVNDNLAKLADSPDIIIFIKGQRLHRLINEDGGPGNHWLKASDSDVWDGFNVNDIPRFVGVHIKQATPSNQHETFYNLIESIPDTHGGFIKLNSLLEAVRHNPRLSRLVFRWVLQNEKRFGIIIGHEIMRVNPSQYMLYRNIVDEEAPELANTFELAHVWSDPTFSQEEIIGPDPNRFVEE
jgi:hypothetical protein